MSENTVKVGVGVMVIQNNKVLMAKRLGKLGFGTYGWCGGHLEFGETFEDCATRELFEETGMKPLTLKFFCVNNILMNDQHYIDIEFVATVGNQIPQLMEPAKHESWDWYDLDKLPSPLFTPCVSSMECYRTNTPHLL